MLLQAAADEWKVPVSASCAWPNGVITHAASGRSTTYGRSQRRRPSCRRLTLKAIVLEGSEDLEGGRQADEAPDTADKLDGSKTLRDRRAACLACSTRRSSRCPVFGGKLVSFDDAVDRQTPRRQGRRARSDDSTVAVVADTWWHAKSALDVLPIRVGRGRGRAATSARIAQHLQDGLMAGAMSTRSATRAMR